MNDEFYIGWEAKAASGIGRSVRRPVIVLIASATALGLALAVMQRTIGAGVFEWGDVKKFSGMLHVEPYPHLLVARPGATNSQLPFSTYYLVAPFKFGLDREKLAPLDGRNVSLRGTLIYRGGQTMIEALPDSFKAAENQPVSIGKTDLVNLGRQTLTGEIVDSKCFLGVMNPGNLAPHRACAIRCISGGIPPMLVVHQKDGGILHVLLVSADGRPVNKQVLDLVAEPVEITGELQRQGELLILRADPSTYRRIK